MLHGKLHGRRAVGRQRLRWGRQHQEEFLVAPEYKMADTSRDRDI
jgi:hypothetical protein